MISIVIPTITGREHWLQKAMYTLDPQLRHQIITVKDRPTCGEAWNDGIEQAKGDYILLAADDIEPAEPLWDEVGIYWADKGYLPCARVLNTDGTLQSAGDWEEEVPTGSICSFARIPFGTKEQFDAIGPIIETHYYTDVWFSAVGKKRGYTTVVVNEFCFYHHFAPEGRVDERFHRDRAEYEWAIRRVA